MNGPETHSASAGPLGRACETCGAVFASKRHWSRFCSDRCRNAFHAAEARVEKIKERAVAMYQALAKIAVGQNDPIGVNADLAAQAIKDLKPPVTPKELLKERGG